MTSKDFGFKKSRISKEKDKELENKLRQFIDDRYPWLKFCSSKKSYAVRRFDFLITEPDFGTKKIARELSEKLNVVLDVDNSSVSCSGQYMIVNIPRKQDEREILRIGNGIDMLLERASDQMLVYIGECDNGEPAFIDFSVTPHLLMGGVPGAGKSTVMHDMILSLMCTHSPDEVRFCILDKKRELSVYKDCPHIMSAAFKNEDFRYTLADIESELESRAQIIADNAEISRYNKKSSKKLPHIFIMFDEANIVIGRDSSLTAADDARSIIKKAADLGRSWGVHVIMSSLKATRVNIDTQLKSDLSARLALQTAEKVDSRILIEQGGAEKLTGKGEAYLKVDNVIKRIQCAYTDDEERRRAIKAICAHWGKEV